jgi:mono/diheme cytochrome c family protein
MRAGTSPDAVVQHVLDGRVSTLTLDTARLRVQSIDADALIAYVRSLPDIEWPRVTAGEAVYTRRCAACHGPFGAPSGVSPPGVQRPRNLADPAWQHEFSDEELVVAVRHGRAGMPGLVPRVSEADARNVAAFVRLFSPGFETYSRYCAACHGERGDGLGGVSTAQPTPAATFDRAYLAAHDNETLRRSVLHMLDSDQPRMPHFRGRLSPAEAGAIVRWFRSNAGVSTPHP